MDQDQNQGDNNHDQATKQNSNDDSPDLVLSAIESENESDSSAGEDEIYNYDHEDYDFFESELGFLEEQYSDDDEEMDDDDDDGIDVDELTYEELIALGEFIGVQERGLSYKEISACLRPIVCKTTSNSSVVVVVDRCVICQVEYEDGEDLVALHCEHAYHSECITKWLHIKKCCPICSSEVSSSSSNNDQTNSNNDCNNKDIL